MYLSRMMMKCFGEKSKSFHCKIVFLDDTELLQEIQSSTLGQDLLDVAFRHLNLLETAYFGLRFLDKTNQTHWLDGGKKVTQQLKGTDPFTLYFGVKFYASDPCKLLEEITRYQFFLQVKQDVLQERLPVAFEMAAELGAYAVQSELGDYDPRRHLLGYISEFKFVTQQSTQFEAHVCEIHKNLVGQVPAIAELNYLEKVKWLDMYGVDLHPVLGEDNVEYFLGLTPSGVIVLRNKSKVGNYFWPRITKVYFKGKYFMLRVRDKNNGESTYGFELPSKQACKHLWKCCVEHHSFFRLTQVCSPNSGKVLGLTSRFSGRSEKSGHLPHQFSIHSSRSQPQVVRVASRRYQRRLGQPDGIDSSLKDEKENEKFETRSNISIPQPVHLPKSKSVSSLPDSPRSIRSAPWEDPRQRGLFSSSTNPSPRSVRSAGWKLPSRGSNSHQRHRHRSPSVESDDSCDSRRRRHSHGHHFNNGHHHHHRHHRSRRNSDNESEKSGGGSKHHSHSRKHGERSSSYHHKESISELELAQKHRYDKPSRSSSNYELINSEAQWSEIQKQKYGDPRKSQSAIIRDLSARKSGYTNSGMESESEVNFVNRKRHRKHRSRSPPTESRHSKGIPPEIRKHIAYQLIDSTTLPENQLKDIPFTNIETESKPFKIKHSPNSNRRSRTAASRHSNYKSNASSETKMPLQADDDHDSPPPPYTPSAVVETGSEHTSKSQGESDDGKRQELRTKNNSNPNTVRSPTIGGNGSMGSNYLYELDLISTHTKANSSTNELTNVSNVTIPSSAAITTTTAGKTGNHKIQSTNNISSEENGRPIPNPVNGLSIRPAASLLNSDNSYQGSLNNQSFHVMGSNFASQLQTSNFEALNNGYNQPLIYSSGIVNGSNMYSCGLPNGHSQLQSNHLPRNFTSHQTSSSTSDISLLPPTALVPGRPISFSQANSRPPIYPNGRFDSLNSKPIMNTNLVTSNVQQQYYNPQQTSQLIPNHHSTLPSRSSNASNKITYQQQVPNGFSSVGKASGIANGFSFPSNQMRPQQFMSSHMASYHTKVLPPNWETIQSNNVNSSAVQQNVQVITSQEAGSTQNAYSKLSSANHHEMSTEL